MSATQMVLWTPRSARSVFVNAEAMCLGAFLADDLTVAWSREYRCACGFRCTGSGDIWDHTQTCSAPSPGPSAGAGAGEGGRK